MEGLKRARASYSRLRWEVQRIGRPWLMHWGVGGAVGLGLLSVSVALGISSVAASAQQAALQRQLDAAAAGEVRPRVQVDYRTKIGAFYLYLPEAREIPGTVRRLLALADAKGLVLKTGEYRVEPQAAAAFQGYRITLPVAGSSAAMQEFLLSALREHKTLALESVNFKRQRIESSKLEARVNLVLLTRADGAVANGGATFR